MREPIKRPGSVKPNNLVIGAFYLHTEFPGVIYQAIRNPNNDEKTLVVYKALAKNQRCVDNNYVVAFNGHTHYWKGFYPKPTKKKVRA